MDNIVVADKASSEITAKEWGSFQLTRPGVVQMPVAPSQVASVNRSGQDLVVNLKSGEQVRIGNFFNTEGDIRSDIVFQGDDGALWQAQYSTESFNGFTFEEVSSIDTLLADTGVIDNATQTFAFAGLGLLGVGGAAAAAGGGGGGGGGGGAAAPAPTAPADLILSPDGLSLQGSGTPGSTINVRDANGGLLGSAVVGSDGRFTVPLSSPQNNGQTLIVDQTDPAGNTSTTTPVTAPDTTPPAAPGNLQLSADGQTLTGTGEAGSTVTVRDANGNVLGSAAVAQDGTFTVGLNSPQTGGQPLTVDQTDAAGNTSTTTPVVAPDTTPPTAPANLQVSADGLTLTGTGEAGSTVTVRDANGNVLGSAVVAQDGTFTVGLNSPQTGGQPLTVEQTDAAGNTSTTTPVAAPDTTPPSAPTNLQVSANGLTLAGTGEAGATVTVRDANGAVLGSAVVAADGSFSVPLSSAQVDGQQLSIVQTDPSGNVSPPVSVTAPDVTFPVDVTPPTAPADLTVSPDGTLLSGRGEIGAQVRVLDNAGNLIGTGVVGADGLFSVTLNPAQTDGLPLSVSLTDAAGNTSSNAAINAPDLTQPTAPTDLAVSADGLTLTGRAFPGLRIFVRTASGVALGSARVGADGLFSVALNPAQLNGEPLEVSAIDASGNSTETVLVNAPDTVAPGAVTDLVVSPDGATIAGKGQPGATVTVRDAGGQILASGLVGANGTFILALAPAVAEGQVLTVSQADGSGLPSADSTVTVPDASGPIAPGQVALSADGTTVTGTGTPGATIEVRDAAGNVLGSAVVDALGNFSVALTSPQNNGQVLDIVAVNPDGTESIPTPLQTADGIAPASATDLAVNPNGLAVTGRGEPGAQVTVTDAQGNVLGTAVVGATGSFTVNLDAAQTLGQPLQVILTDAAGNASAPAGVSAPDPLGPLQPDNFSLNTAGTILSGTGQIGSTVTVTGPNGAVLGSALVGADGNFAVTLNSPQNNGQTLLVSAVGTSGQTSAPVSFTGQDTLAPDAVTNLALSGDRATLNGTGEPGATVTVRDGAGTVLGTALVDGTGAFSVPLAPIPPTTETLQVVQSDVAGNISAPVTTSAPDTTPPVPLANVAISANGTVVSGNGEQGATVTVFDAQGTALGSGIVGANGRFEITLTPAQANGQALTASQADLSNNVSPTVPIQAPDIQAPAAPTNLQLAGDGVTLTGNGEPNATLEVRDSTGAVVGTGGVNPDGTFSLTLTTAQLNGQALEVVQTDAALNASAAGLVTAPDSTPPALVDNLLVSANGATLTGTGEAGSTVTVTGPGGAVLGTALVAADGSFSVALNPTQLNGQSLDVIQTDAALNQSTAVAVTAPDFSAPAQPTNVQIDPTTGAVTGTVQPGATVEVRAADGTLLGSDVADAGGAFSVTPSPLQLNGETLELVAITTGGQTTAPLAVTAPDVTDPSIATNLQISPDGLTVSGTGESGTTAIVSRGGTPLGQATVDPNGVFVVTLNSAALAGETLDVILRDAIGNESPVANLSGPTGNEIAAPVNLVLSADGLVLTGTATVGTTVTVTGANGQVLGTTAAPVGADGTFSIQLSAAQVNGEVLQATASNGALVSVPATTTAADITAPAAPTELAVSADGTTLTGRAEAGASVTVRNANGDVLGTAVAGASGLFTITLTPAQLNAQPLLVSQTDQASNTSADGTLTAPDLQGPAAPAQLSINDAGTVVSGTGEAGATVSIRDNAGAVLATGVVDPSGNFQVTLPAPQVTGAPLQVQLTDAANNLSTPASLPTVDRTPPAAVTALTLSPDGVTLVGRGEAGATVQIRDAAGTVLGTALVGANGQFTATLSPAPTNGETLGVVQLDPAGNVSSNVNLTAQDLSAPAPLSNVVINGNGLTVTGQGEPGATVFVRDIDGNVLGSGLVAGNGAFSVTLTPAQTNAQLLTINQEDPPGNEGPAVSLTAPDLVAPVAPADLTLNGPGLQVTGTGEAGSTITVSDGSGRVLGTGVVAANGTFQVTLSEAQLNGQALSVTSRDAAGNLSAATALTAGDTTAPVPVTALAVSADGATLTGLGEAGAQISVTGPTGTVLGTTTVAGDGTFSLGLTPPASTNALLSVVQTDVAGNVSTPATVTAPGNLAPDTPSNLALSADGLTLTGTGTPRSFISVRRFNGQLLGTAQVADDGNFSVALNPAQLNGESLSVSAAFSDGLSSTPAPITADDNTAPDALIEYRLASDGVTLTGRGEAGATVQVTNLDGVELGTALVAADGTFTATLGPAQISGQQLNLVQVDAAGNESAAVSLVAPDRVAPPIAADLALDATGTVISGTGEAGASVAVRDATGTLLGSGVVRVDGTFQVTLSSPQINGQQLAVTLTDAAGNASTPAALLAGDTTIPAPLTNLAIAGDGATITGRGEPGATVTVRDNLGAVLTTGAVDATGAFTVVLPTPQTNAELLSLTQSDAALNVSPATTLTAPDTTPPAPLVNVAINATGTTITGSGEPGANITVRDASGTALGTTQILADGTFSVTLAPAQINLQALTVQQADQAGNIGQSAGVTAPDLTAPAAPTGLVVSANGDQLTGTGEAGAQVRVSLADGTLLATTTVAGDGTFVVALNPPRANADALNVVLIDAAQNVSQPGSITTPDTTPPAAVDNLVVGAQGNVLTGTGEPGATVTVTSGNATLGSVVVAGDGTFTVNLAPAQVNGEPLSVTQADPTGNTSGAVLVNAPDTTPPAIPADFAITADGLTLIGSGEPGATVQVRNGSQGIIGTGVVDANGDFIIALSAPQLNAEVLTLRQVDAAGNASTDVTFQVPDATAAAPVANLALSADGLVLTGTGQPGATVSVSSAGVGLNTGVVTVAADGTFSVTLSAPQLNGQVLDVTQTDASTIPSAPTAYTAADITAPGTPTVSSRTESSVTGTAEAGSTVTIRAADGTALGSAVADVDGNYTAPLAPIQNTGAPLTATASDAAGNASAALPFTAVDTTPPAAVTGLSISTDLDQLSGIGEPGATVTVTAAVGGATLGTAVVAADGTFVVDLVPAAVAEQDLDVIQTDAAGNDSGSTPFAVPIDPPTPAPTALVLADAGATLTGLAVANSTVDVRAPGGALLGSTTANADGTFTVSLSPAQNNGETFLVTATTATGGTSIPTLGIAPDNTDPAPLDNLAIGGNGTLVTGTGEAGATVEVRNAAGTLLGTTTVANNGSFSVTLNSSQINGQVLSAVQTDPAGNVSPVSQVTAGDSTAPLLATNLAVNAAGLLLTGSGEANAIVRVTNAAGTVLGEGTVAGDGTFSVTLNQAQTNGQALNISLTDAAGNTSQAAIVNAGDTTAPVAPSNLAVAAGGLVLTGNGEVGATILVTSATGTPLGNAVVGAGGTFSVQLASAQVNGQVLTVVQTDAAGNQSPSAPATAPDTTPPVVATGLSVSADGTTLSGTGEAGSTARVFNAGGQLLGSALVAANGSFTVTLTPAQNDGQALSVRLTDVATNESLPASVTAPDTTPPAAPATATINSAGTLMTGTGFAGARIFIRSFNGTQLGTAVVAADGTWSATLTPAQIDNQALSVTQVDAAGNVSTALPVTAPDLTAPVPASGLLLSADGTTLSGSAEAGATITVRNGAGTALGTATAQANGTFSVTLSGAQINGETLNVSVTDPRGNVSTIATLVAPDVDVDRPVVASDNLTTATVTLSPVTTTRNILDSFPTVLGVGFSHTFNFNVASGTTARPTLTLTDGGLLNLNTGATYTLQVKDASGSWVTLGTAGNGALLNLELLAGTGIRVNVGTLQAGDYRIVFASNSISLLTTINSNLQLDVTSLTQFNSVAGAAVTGNVISDIGTDGTADITGPDNGAQLRVQNGNAGYVNAGAGTTVQGLYGSLTIDAQGNYTYRANGSATSVGKVDVFNYQLVHPNGKSDTATLYVRIDSPQATEVWSSTNLAAPAFVVDATNDIASTSITLGNLMSTTTSNLGTLNTLLGLGSTGNYGFTVAPNTVSDLTITLSSSSLLSLLGSVNLGLYKLNTATNQYVLVKSWAGGTLVGLGGGAYGATVDDQTQGTYRVTLTVGGVAVATSINVGLINSATYTSQFVVNSYTPVSGNLLTDTAGGGADVLGSSLTVLSVLAAAGTYVQPGFNGTSITGTYGTLLVRADGSYTYTLKAGLTSAVIGQEDVFTYQLTHPNGTTDTATLTIDLNQAGAARAFIASVDDDGSSFSALGASTGGETLTGTDGNDTLDGSQGGAVTLDGGAGDDTLIISDQDFVAVNGGTGTDTLLWAGGDASIDLGNLQDRLSNIEVIDLNDTSAVQLTVSLADLIAITEPDQSTLFIKGSEQDSVHMTGQWSAEGTQLADGLEYTQYTPQEDPTHHLWVQNGIQVV
ncbi:BapA/Bap/LapF family large adhesin [Pseudomonas sp. JDS28PS106]|uniref:BapA/Bap/LapF family large adhesin n=1 Tax=Pseudomonas sp. JDS28PS106 TaxID=2497235 RepID=UPI002FD0D8A9